MYEVQSILARYEVQFGHAGSCAQSNLETAVAENQAKISKAQEKEIYFPTFRVIHLFSPPLSEFN